MILAALLFIRRGAVTTTVSMVTPVDVEAGRAHILQDSRFRPTGDLPDPGPVPLWRYRQDQLITDQIDRLPPIVVRLRNMTAIDATGIRALEDLAERLRGRAARSCSAARASKPVARMERGPVPRASRGTQDLPRHRGSAFVAPKSNT